MYWFLRVVRDNFKIMTKQEVDDFINEYPFSDIERRVIKDLSLGFATKDIMVRQSLKRDELYRHYEVIAKQLQQHY